MRAADIESLIAVGRPDISRDGSFAVYATSRPDIRANRYVGQVWRADLPHGRPRRLTRGVADAAPLISPDGSRVLFRRPDAGGRAQLFVVRATGGEAVQITDEPLGIAEHAWTPDGDRAVFLARVSEPGRYGTVAGLEPAAEAPRRVTGIRWHANGVGYIADRPSHVFVVPVADPDDEPAYPAAARVGESEETPTVPVPSRRVTLGDESHSALAVHEGRVFTVVDAIESARRDLSSRVVAVGLDDGNESEVVGADARLTISDLAVCGDGTLALLAADVGERGVDFVAPATGLFLVGADGVRRVHDADRFDLGEAGSHLTVVGDDLLVQNRTRGRVHLLRVARDGTASAVLDGDVEVSGHAASGTRVVAAAATPGSLGELFLMDGGEARCLTHHGEAGAIAPVPIAEHEITGRDGYPIHGWSAIPDGEGPHPVILQIHGGPYAAYGIHLFDETQVLVDAGYAVVYCNPRGSAGYGSAHGRSIRQAMGTVDMADVLDFLDGLLAADPRLDGDRVGIMGGSYGGYLTAWTIAHEERFAAAIVERGFLDPVSFQGTSDIGTFFGDEYVGTDPEAIAAQSPMAVVDRVTTPTLVIHSEADYRCPLEQATRYYSALKRQGVETEMLIFPGEDHELTRAGQPRHRVERFDAVLGWWARHLPIG